MVRLSMNEMTTYRWSFEEDVANYAAAEIPAIGVWRQKLADYGEERGAELILSSGLEVSNVLWAGGFTGSDGRSLRESIDDAADAVRVTADLRCPCLVVYSGSRSGHTLNHAGRLLREALKELLPVAAELNVSLAIEPMHPSCAGEWTFLTGIDETLSLVLAMDHPRLQVAFDTYHLCHDPTWSEKIGELAGRIAVVHLGDGKGPPDPEQNRARLGEGTLPLREVIATLVAHGYDGFFDVELMGEEIEASDYRELLAHSKQAFGQLMPCPVQKQ